MSTAPTTPTQYLFDLGNSRLKYAPLAADGGISEVVAIAHDIVADGLGRRTAAAF
jgi:hypothetical protein